MRKDIWVQLAMIVNAILGFIMGYMLGKGY